MEERKRRRGDRKDGYWLRDLPAMTQFMPHLYPNRADNEAYVNLDIDLRPLDAYLERLNQGRTEDKYTYFHLISAAIGKAFVLRPRMNRFIAYNRVYQRKYISIAFVVKKKFEDQSEEGLAFQYFDENSTLEQYHTRLMQQIHQCRREDEKDTSSGMMDVLVKLPPAHFAAGDADFVLPGSPWEGAHVPDRHRSQLLFHFYQQSRLHRLGMWLSSPVQLGHQFLLCGNWQEADEGRL